MRSPSVPAILLLALAVAPARGRGAEAEQLARLVEKEWADGKFPSLSAAVVGKDGPLAIRAFGVADRKAGRAATPETLYRIASVTKPFTATLLVLLRDRGVVGLDDPVARHLPAGLRLPVDPRGAPAITLRHLATHASGLPRVPPNLAPRGRDLYGGYTLEALYAGLAALELEAPVGARYAYSNLGYGLLGHALERAAGEPYETLIRKLLAEPLGMKDTTVTLSDRQRSALAIGYEGDGSSSEAEPWDLGCLAPAGGLVSSAADLARWVALELRAGEPGLEPIAGGSLAETQTPQRLLDGWDGAVGLGWHIRRGRGPSGDIASHDGHVAGFRSYVGFSPSRRVGVVLLANCEQDLAPAGRRIIDEAARSFGVEPRANLDPRLDGVAASLSRGFASPVPEGLAALFHAQFLAECPADRVAAVLREAHAAYGSCDRFELGPARGQEPGPRRATIQFRFANEKAVRCDVEIDRGGKIVYLFFPPWKEGS